MEHFDLLHAVWGRGRDAGHDQRLYPGESEMREFLEFLKTPVGKFFIVWAAVSVGVVGTALVRK